ncbi:hypothetical protein PF007_g4698 [Phytophthora fragariae]|uniref:Uncharacterized protein n=1 Tax=Phytophthora fragariae TaxID=53985 RepID=A0A6A3T5M2_9STRA|nr:hypothetical protein PF007_g4698 [Phytophthora fragariae]
MGAQIASGLSPAARQRVVGIASDVAGYLRAATTQMTMYTDAEAAAAIDESVARVKSADESLSNYIRESILTDDTFKAMYRDREGYQVVSTKHLRNFSWLGKGTNSTTPESIASSADGVPTCEEVDEVETSRASVDNARKRPRVSKRMRSRDIDTDHGKQIVEGADSALTDPTIVGSGGYPEIEVGGSTGCDVAGACDINDVLMSSSEENDNVESESADEEENQDVIEYQWSDSKSSDSSGGSLYEETNAEKAGQADRGVTRRRGLREQLSKEDALFVWMDCQDGGDPRSIHIYRDDLDSLLSLSSMTGTVLDYFIYRDMVKQNGLVCSYGTSLYLSMEVARFTRNPKKKLRLLKDLIEQSDWKTYRYVLFPVSGRNHSSAYAFDVAKWLLTKLHEMELHKAATVKQCGLWVIRASLHGSNFKSYSGYSSSIY